MHELFNIQAKEAATFLTAFRRKMSKEISLLLAKSVAILRKQGVLSSPFVALEETIPNLMRKCKRDTLPS